MYKQASKLRLRFQTSNGPLTTEQLWSLPLNSLDKLAVELEEEYKQSGKKSFLVAKSKKDKEIKLKFDIVLDILSTKVEERDIISKEADTKAHNQKILGLIQKKKESELEDLSVEELEKQLK